MPVKDKTKLVLKKITDKLGKRTSVWVKPSVGTSVTNSKEEGRSKIKRTERGREREQKQREDKERGSSTPLLKKLDGHKETQAEMREKYGDLSYEQMKKQVAKEEGLDSYNDFDEIERRVFQINEWTSGERVNDLREEIKTAKKIKEEQARRKKQEFTAEEKEHMFKKWGDAGFTRDEATKQQSKFAEQLAPFKKTFEGTKKAMEEIASKNPGGEVLGRVKAPDSTAFKLIHLDTENKYKQDVNNLNDATGFMIKRQSQKDLIKDRDLIRKRFKVLEERDYVSEPQGDYRAIHMIVEDDHGKKMEIQLKTENQYTWAEWNHDIYKPMTPSQVDMLQKAGTAIKEYSSEIAEYFAKIDRGLKAIIPKCFEAVASVFGCLP